MRMTPKLIAALAIFSVLLTSCGSGGSSDDGGSETGGQRSTETKVVLHELSDADMLNPFNYQSASASYIFSNIFMSLLAIDHETTELVPWLAKSRPEIVVNDDNTVELTYEIRDEAVWDNGSPVTAKDVEFSFKVIKNPKVDCHRIRPYYEFIDGVIWDEANPKKFTVTFSEKYMSAEIASGDMSVLPKHIYDPDGMMDEFSIKQLNDDASLSENQTIIDYAEFFNSEKFKRDPETIQGCGGYFLKRWQTGQRTVLEKKENWWGDKFNGEATVFNQNAQTLLFETINDQTTAKEALKAGEVDVMRGIKASDFVKLRDDSEVKKQFNLFTPDHLSFSYLGVNMRLKKFEDKRTRQALAHLLDVDKIIENVSYGFGVPVVSPYHPSRPFYNHNLKRYAYDIEKAKALLAEAGWEDTNNNGILDKVIDGNVTDFTIELTYNTGNDARKNVCLMFQEEARKVGIDVNVTNQEWSIYLENQKDHNFEMYYGAWISGVPPSDPKQLWHTESYNGGSNYCGFGNAESDEIIEKIRTSLDIEEQKPLYFRLQEIILEESPYLYIQAPYERIAISKKFPEARVSIARPGYWAAGLVNSPN